MKKRSDKIMFWDDERSLGHSIVVTLEYGWRFTGRGDTSHVAGFDTVQEARKGVREAIECACDLCNRRNGK